MFWKLFGKKSVKRNKDTGGIVERYIKSFFHAVDGIGYAIRYEHNMIIILIATIVVTIFGFIYRIDYYEWLFIILICGVIAACELFNSAVEAIVDLVTTDVHPLAKIAKDVSAGASLILVIVSIIGGIIIFVPKIFGI